VDVEVAGRHPVAEHEAVDVFGALDGRQSSRQPGDEDADGSSLRLVEVPESRDVPTWLDDEPAERDCLGAEQMTVPGINQVIRPDDAALNGVALFVLVADEASADIHTQERRTCPSRRHRFAVLPVPPSAEKGTVGRA
jgi:hypothetical protein